MSDDNYRSELIRLAAKYWDNREPLPTYLHAEMSEAGIIVDEAERNHRRPGLYT